MCSFIFTFWLKRKKAHETSNLALHIDVTEGTKSSKENTDRTLLLCVLTISRVCHSLTRTLSYSKARRAGTVSRAVTSPQFQLQQQILQLQGDDSHAGSYTDGCPRYCCQHTRPPAITRRSIRTVVTDGELPLQTRLVGRGLLTLPWIHSPLSSSLVMLLHISRLSTENNRKWLTFASGPSSGTLTVCGAAGFATVPETQKRADTQSIFRNKDLDLLSRAPHSEARTRTWPVIEIVRPQLERQVTGHLHRVPTFGEETDVISENNSLSYSLSSILLLTFLPHPAGGVTVEFHLSLSLDIFGFLRRFAPKQFHLEVGQVVKRILLIYIALTHAFIFVLAPPLAI
ncbi:hypothetical protein J6590_055874 [Homalodisca vitripennis]|nr:hypothetical protein J6590_055874 [Homalodisca vitripennis]